MLHCPDCDTVVHNTGCYPCPGCDTHLIVTLVDNVQTVRTKAVNHHFHHSKPAPSKKGITIDYDPGHTPTVGDSDPMAPVVCIHCETGLQSTISSIRARVMKGLLETLKDGPIDPTTGEPIQMVSRIPMYKTGRLCPACMDLLTCTRGDKPPKMGQFEALHERVGLRKRHTVTAGMIKSANLQERREKEVPKYIDFGDVQVKQEEPLPEPVDVAAYRAFNRMGRTKSHVKHDLVTFDERGR